MCRVGATSLRYFEPFCPRWTIFIKVCPSSLGPSSRFTWIIPCGDRPAACHKVWKTRSKSTTNLVVGWHINATGRKSDNTWFKKAYVVNIRSNDKYFWFVQARLYALVIAVFMSSFHELKSLFRTGFGKACFLLLVLLRFWISLFCCDGFLKTLWSLNFDFSRQLILFSLRHKNKDPTEFPHFVALPLAPHWIGLICLYI